jgi:mono/diheme cytochrome c family protein
MRHVVVTRTVVVLGLALAGACLAFAAVQVSRSAPEARGAPASPAAEVFARRCAGCHAIEEVAPVAGGAEERTRLLRFLAGHGQSDPSEDAALADFLLGFARPR